MSDAESALPPSKKRVAGREISKDNPGLDDDDDEQEGELGTFKRASEEVLATRRMVKVRRQQTNPSSSSNPFAGIQLVAPSKPSQDNAAKVPLQEQEDTSNNEIHEDSQKKSQSNVDDVEAHTRDSAEKSNEVASQVNVEVGHVQEATYEIIKEVVNDDIRQEETDTEKTKTEIDSRKNHDEENADKKTQEAKGASDNAVDQNQKKTAAEVSDSLSSFQQLSSRQNAFTGLAGTGFSTTSFSFGLISSEGSAFNAGSRSLFGQSGENQLHSSSIGIGNSSNGGASQIFGSASSEAAPGVSKAVMQEVSVETGEENENAVFSADALLFEYIDGGWKERGKGELKLNITTDTEKARLVMRARGNYRLILNASLFSDMSLKSMEKRGVTFACVNSATEGNDGFSTFALKFKEASILKEFCYSIETYKGKKDAAAKAP